MNGLEQTHAERGAGHRAHRVTQLGVRGRLQFVIADAGGVAAGGVIGVAGSQASESTALTKLR